LFGRTRRYSANHFLSYPIVVVVVFVVVVLVVVVAVVVVVVVYVCGTRHMAYDASHARVRARCAHRPNRLTRARDASLRFAFRG